MNKGKKIWTENLVKKLTKLFNEKKSSYEMSIELGLTRKQITNKLRVLGYKIGREKSHLHKHERINCLNCDKIFNVLKVRNSKFCSQSCNGKFHNRYKRKKTKKYCKHCNQPLITGKIFCSLKCGNRFKRILKYKQIENGTYPYADPRLFKLYLIEKYGEKCMECGWCEKNPISGRIPIELHHDDGNPDNNNLSNLKLLCPNHHALTKNWKKLNENGRHSRRRQKRNERYKNGKSS